VLKVPLGNDSPYILSLKKNWKEINWNPNLLKIDPLCSPCFLLSGK